MLSSNVYFKNLTSTMLLLPCSLFSNGPWYINRATSPFKSKLFSHSHHTQNKIQILYHGLQGPSFLVLSRCLISWLLLFPCLCYTSHIGLFIALQTCWIHFHPSAFALAVSPLSNGLFLQIFTRLTLSFHSSSCFNVFFWKKLFLATLSLPLLLLF